MPFLVRFLIRHALVGLAIAVVAVGLIMWSDISGLGTLIARSEQGLFVLVLLTVMMGLTFSSLQMGFAVMLLPGDDKPGPGGKRKLRDWLDAAGLMPPRRPVRVRAGR